MYKSSLLNGTEKCQKILKTENSAKIPAKLSTIAQFYTVLPKKWCGPKPKPTSST